MVRRQHTTDLDDAVSSVLRQPQTHEFRLAFVRAGCRFAGKEVLGHERHAVAKVLAMVEQPRDASEKDVLTAGARRLIRDGIISNSPVGARRSRRTLERAVLDVMYAAVEAFRDEYCDCTSDFCDCARPVELPTGVTTRQIVDQVESALRETLAGRHLNAAKSPKKETAAAHAHVDGDAAIVQTRAALERGYNVSAVRDSLGQVTDATRSRRGRELARSAVATLKVTSRGVTARVAKSESEGAYRVRCSWLVGVSIPKDLPKITTECACSDTAAWCEHVAAVLYVLAAELDIDPSAITKAIDGDAPWNQRLKAAG